VNCPTCDRILVPDAEWRKLTHGQRKRAGRTHARRDVDGLCHGCHEQAKRHTEHPETRYYWPRGEVAYPGGWLPGLIQRPTMTRCPE